jgi:hypothetical protein
MAVFIGATTVSLTAILFVASGIDYLFIFWARLSGGLVVIIG